MGITYNIYFFLYYLFNILYIYIIPSGFISLISNINVSIVFGTYRWIERFIKFLNPYGNNMPDGAIMISIEPLAKSKKWLYRFYSVYYFNIYADFNPLDNRYKFNSSIWYLVEQNINIPLLRYKRGLLNN